MKPIAVLSLLIASLTAACHRRGAHDDPNRLTSYLDWKLDLSDDQERIARRLAEEVVASRGRLAEEKKRVRLAFEPLIVSPSLREEDLMRLMEPVESLGRSEVSRLFPLMAQFHASLSLEQREKLRAVIADDWDD